MGVAYHYFTIKPGLFEVRDFIFYKKSSLQAGFLQLEKAATLIT